MRVYTDALTGRDSIAMVARVRHGAAGLEARGEASSPVAGAGASASAAAAAASVRDVPAGCAVLRVQDACITSEVFGSVKCDCASQLDYSMALLARLAGDAWAARSHRLRTLRADALGSASAAAAPGVSEGEAALGCACGARGAARDAEASAPCARCIGAHMCPCCSSAEAAQSSSGCVCRSSSSDSGSPAIDGAGSDAIVGLVVYLLQEGRGIGLAAKVSAYALQEDGGGGGGGGDSSSSSGGGSASQGTARGLDTVDANRALGLPDDSREYSAVSDILRDVGLLPGDAAAAPPLYLLSNTPRKAAALGALGGPLAGSLPCYVEPVSPHAQRYLRVKAERMGHVLPQLS